MTDSFNSTESPSESNSALNLLIAGVGVLLMLCACSLVPAILVRNTQLFQSVPATTAAPFVYTGQQVVTVPAGSRSISALSHSSQAPVVVMFDADW